MIEDRKLPGVGEPACGRQPLIDAITRFLARRHAPSLVEIRASLERTLDDAGPEAISRLSERLTTAGSDWDYYPGDPLARRIHHVLADPVLQQEPVVTGVTYLEEVRDRPLVMFANHLSYSDANAIDVLLQKADRRDICDRLTVVAGPKVYSNVGRRFSSLCFGTIKVPQNAGRSSEEAVLNARDVVRGARRSIRIARERLGLGEALLIFAEGSRSRSGQMQQLLSGVARYLEGPNTWVLTAGLTGTERLFPIGEDALNPGPVTLRIGRPVPAQLLKERTMGDRRAMMDCIGLAIAALLPAGYRGVYGSAFQDRETARIAKEIFQI